MEEIAYVQQIVTHLIDFFVQYSFQIIGALITLVIGIFIARWLSGVVMRLCEKKGMDVTLTRFTGQVVKILVMIFVIIIVIGKFGISIAPFIAAIGAMIFGASFAIAGPLSNYGAGLVIILTRPFVVGNTISVKGVDGIVEEVSLSTTVLSTEDGERITIPNKHIVGEVLTNSFENKVVEASVGISYNDDPEKAISLIGEVLDATEQVVKDPAPIIGIERYAESSIQIGIRYWIPTRHYFKILYAVNLAIHKKLKQAGITIPFPQLDLHVVEKGSGLKG